MCFEFLLIHNPFAPHVVVAHFGDNIFATDFIALDIERISRVTTWLKQVLLSTSTSAIILKPLC